MDSWRIEKILPNGFLGQDHGFKVAVNHPRRPFFDTRQRLAEPTHPERNATEENVRIGPDHSVTFSNSSIIRDSTALRSALVSSNGRGGL